jgi:hypothetical protein
VRAEANLPPDGPASGVKVILGLIELSGANWRSLPDQSEKRLVGLGVAMPGPFGLEALRRQQVDDGGMAEVSAAGDAGGRHRT